MSDASDNLFPELPDSIAASGLPLKQALENNSIDIPDLTGQVMAQFSADLQQPLPCEYDIAFVSAYYDQALAEDAADRLLVRQRIETFEQHLPQCLPCSEHLGNIFAVSTLYKRHCCAVEVQIDHFTCTQRVMTAYRKGDSKLRRWVPLTLASIAASVLILFTAVRFLPGNTLTTASPSVAVNPTALEQALVADKNDPSQQTTTDNAQVVDVSYQTPESYLFSQSSDILPSDKLSSAHDVSAIVLNESP